MADVNLKSTYEVKSDYNVKSTYRQGNVYETLPKALRRYGGKGEFYQDYEPYILELVRDLKSKGKEGQPIVFCDLFGGGGTLSILAATMTDKHTGEQLFDEVIYNDLDIGASLIFSCLTDTDKTSALIDAILKMDGTRETFNQCRELMKIINSRPDEGISNSDYCFNQMYNISDYIQNYEGRIDADTYYILQKLYKKYYRLYTDKTRRRVGLSNDEKFIIINGNNDSSFYRGVSIAAAEYVRTFLSFNSAGETYRDYLSNNYGVDFEREMHKSAMRLRDIVPYLRHANFSVYSKSAIDWLADDVKKKKERILTYKNTKQYLYFLDPPYLKRTRGKNAENLYDLELSDEEHKKMIDSLKELDHWILCGYESDIETKNNPYKELEKMEGVEKEDLGEKHLSSRIIETEHHNREVIWYKI